VYEKHQTTDTRDKRPRPSHDLSGHETNCSHMADHSMAPNAAITRGPDGAPVAVTRETVGCMDNLGGFVPLNTPQQVPPYYLPPA